MFSALFGAPLQSAARSIFEFTVKDISGKEVSLGSYRGAKAFLVVNVASQWGLTERNYEELRVLYERCKPRGLEILAFPCNQFGAQEPGTNEEIREFATARGATYPLFAKIDVNGDTADPLYVFLKASIDNGILGQGIKWNFSKFLCDSEGVPVKRYSPTTNPLAIEPDIEQLLNA